MKTEIILAVRISSEWHSKTLPKVIENILPLSVCKEIELLGNRYGCIEEIRLRCNRCASVSVCGKNILLSSVLTREEMDSFISAICRNSLYAYRDTINNGYVTLEGGLRVGLCGRATIDDGKLLGIYDVSSVNIRIPHAIRNVGEPICRMLRSGRDSRGVLIYAPPGEGKTTLLCAVCAKMAGGDMPLRVVIVDTRGEISASLNDRRLCIDVLSGYPRGLGIEIATRTLSAQLIVCDEIGGEKEAEAIISAQNSGVPFVASAHADNILGLLKRSAIAKLHMARVFGTYVGIKRSDDGVFTYTVSDWEEADAILHSDRSDSHSLVRS